MNNRLESGRSGDPCGSPIKEQNNTKQNSVYKVRQLKELDGSARGHFCLHFVLFFFFFVEVLGEFSIHYFLVLCVGSSSFNSITLMFTVQFIRGQLNGTNI